MCIAYLVQNHRLNIIALRPTPSYTPLVSRLEPNCSMRVAYV